MSSSEVIVDSVVFQHEPPITSSPQKYVSILKNKQCVDNQLAASQPITHQLYSSQSTIAQQPSSQAIIDQHRSSQQSACPFTQSRSPSVSMCCFVAIFVLSFQKRVYS